MPCWNTRPAIASGPLTPDFRLQSMSKRPSSTSMLLLSQERLLAVGVDQSRIGPGGRSPDHVRLAGDIQEDFLFAGQRVR